jgi:4'-phosphopantetheinyl transferase
MLSGAELDRARRITHYESWLQFVRARALLRLMLNHCTGLPPHSFAFADETGEAPRLIDNPWGLHLSVSHSFDWAIVVVGDAPLGIDLERMHPDCDWERIAEVCFHPNEQQCLRQAPQQLRLDAFFEIWTRKEAYLKGIGVGMAEDPSAFSVACDSISTHRRGTTSRAWYVQDVEAPPGYKAALASEQRRPSIAPIDLQQLLGGMAVR